MASRGNKNRGEKEQAAIRRLEALELRMQGFSYRQIGPRLDISEAQAHRDVTEALRLVVEDHREEIEEMRAIENTRLDALFVSAFEMATSDCGNETLRAIDVCIRVMKRRAELNGVDMPIRIASEASRQEVNIAQVIQNIQAMSTEELLQETERHLREVRQKNLER
jgi:hypothetical protein